MHSAWIDTNETNLANKANESDLHGSLILHQVRSPDAGPDATGHKTAQGLHLRLSPSSHAQRILFKIHPKKTHDIPVYRLWR